MSVAEVTETKGSVVQNEPGMLEPVYNSVVRHEVVPVIVSASM